MVRHEPVGIADGGTKNSCEAVERRIGEQHIEQVFHWLSHAPLRPNFDLRCCGWVLVENDKWQDDKWQDKGIVLLDASTLDDLQLMQRLGSFAASERSRIIIAGIASSSRRALLLQLGFGDVVSNDIAIEEICVRSSAMLRRQRQLPRFRQFGKLKLDLLAREAYADNRSLNLNPREFALLWRLTDAPNHSVSKSALIRDVWHMGFMPETNSIAVHMSRLRRKLSFADLAGIIETASTGGYRLRVADSADEGEDDLEMLRRLPATGGKPSNSSNESSAAHH